MNHAIAAEHPNPDVAALATLGMRIRKAVAEGHKTGHASSYRPQQRQPLPAHMAQPPSLMGGGSTIDLCLDLSSWEARQAPLQTISTPPAGTKRKHDEDPQVYYGPLSFNENF